MTKTHSNSSDILQGLNATIEPVKKSPTYFIGLFTSFFFVVLLPILYILLIFASAGGVFYHAVYNAGILDIGISGRGGLLVKAFLYFGPLIAGTAMVFFMTKPLFAKREESVEAVEVTREEEPLFFAFIDKICAAVNAPVPTKVCLDTEVNASASILPGISGFFGGKLVLTVGIPLLRGMNTRELAGVLAHEFGHFSQGTGMRISYVIRSINGWFQRIVFERDQWDERLQSLSENIDFRIGVFLFFARLMVWLSRKVLWLFMMMSHFVSMFLLRQMEFDADRYEARLAGSEQFPKTAKHLIALGAAYSAAHDATGFSFDEGVLPDDFGLLTAHYQHELSPEIEKKVEAIAQDEEGTIWDTHPANGIRNKMALKEAAEGIFTIEAENALLFKNIDALSKRCTKHLYSLLLEEKLDDIVLVTTETTIQKSKRVTNDYDAYSRFYGDSVCFPAPLNISSMDELAQCSQEDSHVAVQEIKEKAVALNQTFDKEYGSFITKLQGTTLLKAGYTFKKGVFGLEHPDVKGGTEAVEVARVSLKSATEDLYTVHTHYCHRIKSAIPALDAAVLDPLLTIIKTLEAQADTVTGLMEEFHATRIVVEQEPIEAEERWNTIVAQCTILHTHLSDIEKALSGLSYPFEHSKNDISLTEYIFEEGVPKSDEHQEVYEKANAVFDTITSFYSRVLGRVALHVEEYENSLGLPQIDLSVKEDEQDA